MHLLLAINQRQKLVSQYSLCHAICCCLISFLVSSFKYLSCRSSKWNSVVCFLCQDIFDNFLFTFYSVSGSAAEDQRSFHGNETTKRAIRISKGFEMQNCWFRDLNFHSVHVCYAWSWLTFIFFYMYFRCSSWQSFSRSGMHNTSGSSTFVNRRWKGLFSFVHCTFWHACDGNCDEVLCKFIVCWWISLLIQIVNY